MNAATTATETPTKAKTPTSGRLDTALESKAELPSRSEWIAVPVSLEGSGLDRAKVE
jgi:hypothetical protein